MEFCTFIKKIQSNVICRKRGKHENTMVIKMNLTLENSVACCLSYEVSRLKHKYIYKFTCAFVCVYACVYECKREERSWERKKMCSLGEWQEPMRKGGGKDNWDCLWAKYIWYKGVIMKHITLHANL